MFSENKKRMKKDNWFIFQKILIAALFSIFLLVYGSAAEVSQEKQVRFALWAYTEVYPGYFDSDNVSEDEKKLNRENNSDVTYSVPIKKIKEIAPFLIEGMVYGWRFDYTPSDKARGVKEYFELSPVQVLSESDIAKINYAKPWVEGNKLSAWVEFPRTESQIRFYNSWLSILHPRIKGIGYARLAEGFSGIKKAAEEAVKNAVREYERTQIKTKPKEIMGVVLISQPPLIGIDAGQYRITLDFFMQSDKIVEYKTF